MGDILSRPAKDHDMNTGAGGGTAKRSYGQAKDVDIWRNNSGNQTPTEASRDVSHDSESSKNDLLTAVLENDSQQTKLLVQSKRVNPNELIFGVYPMVVAIELNHLGPLQTLLEGGARTNVKGTNGASAIGKCMTNCVKIYQPSSLDMLLSKGGDPNRLDDFNMAPLHYAIGQHNHLAIDKLMDAGADVNLIGDSILEHLVPHMDACFHFCPPDYNLSEVLLRLMGNLRYRSKCHDPQLEAMILRFLDNAAIIWQIAKDWEDHNRWESYLDIVRLCCSVGYTPTIERLRQVKRLFPPKVYKVRLSRFIERPRALQDLCRIQVRNNLTGRMEEEVEKLPLPRKVQDYLMIRNRVHFTRI